MSLIVDFALLCFGFFLLTKGADYFIENSASFAEEKGISPHVVGVTIVAFGTSLPELLVSIISSFQDYNDLALGNIVGSNISNIGLVLAVSTFIFYYVLDTHIVPDNDANNDSYVMLLAVFLLFFFSTDNLISQSEGALFFTLYLFYIYWLYRRSSESPINEEIEENTSFSYLIGGLVGLLLGAQVTVDAAVSIAESMGVSEIVIGLSVVAAQVGIRSLGQVIECAASGGLLVSIKYLFSPTWSYYTRCSASKSRKVDTISRAKADEHQMVGSKHLLAQIVGCYSDFGNRYILSNIASRTVLWSQP